MGDTAAGVHFPVLEGTELTNAELARSVEVLRAAFPTGWPAVPVPVSAEEHLRWKLEGPGGSGSLVRLTKLDGVIVGFSSRLRRTVLERGTPRLGAISADGSVHPDYQGRGIGRARRVQRGDAYGEVDFVWGVSQNPVALRLNRYTNMVPLGRRLRVMVRPLDTRRLVELEARDSRLPAPLMALGLRGVLVVQALVRRPPAVDPARPVDVRAVTEVDSRFDGLWRQAAEDFDFVLVRDANYLRWRYLDPRGGDFTLLQAEHEGKLLGYLAFALDEERCRIADVLTLPGRIDVASALVGEALARARGAEAAAVACWLPAGHSYMPALRGHGFLDSRRDTGLQYRVIRADVTELEVLRDPAARLHITQGDMDVV